MCEKIYTMNTKRKEYEAPSSTAVEAKLSSMLCASQVNAAWLVFDTDLNVTYSQEDWNL